MRFTISLGNRGEPLRRWVVGATAVLALMVSACAGDEPATGGGNQPPAGDDAAAGAESVPAGSADFMGRAAPTWVEQLERSDDRVERAKAVAALTSIGPTESGVVEALIGATADEDALVRTGSSRALGGFDRQVAPALIEALASDPDPAVRAGVAPILGNWADDDTVNAALSDALRGDDDAAVRTAAARGLSVGGAASVAGVAALIDALGDESPDVRQWAAVALGRIGPGAADAVEALTEVEQDEVRMVANAARSALRQIQQ